MYSHIISNLNLGQDVANKTAAHIVANSYSLYQTAGMRRCRSLININPSDLQQRRVGRKFDQIFFID